MMKAILWDVDGTLAETERDGHRVAFNRAFEALGLPWRWDERRYGELLRITGGRERLLHDMASRSDAPVLAAERLALARELHARKNVLYASVVASAARSRLRDGVAPLIEQAAARGRARRRSSPPPAGSTSRRCWSFTSAPRWPQRFRRWSAAKTCATRSRTPRPTNWRCDAGPVGGGGGGDRRFTRWRGRRARRRHRRWS